MGRALTDIIAALPADEQEAIEARYQELKQNVEGLRELRQIAGKAQAEIASALNIRQPSVSQIERQTDMYLSTLRSYVEAIGGKLELSVKLPARPVLKLEHLGEVPTSIRGQHPGRPTAAGKMRRGQR
ncbi:XRE family transcriptional regulator [Bosea lathyri]|uniref:Helix-turn-helix domain-containing protein n=1 Tax=Bosea lathyri TaxID=1036778 RepID=A0A1H6CWC2_9HYPH|nr:XRE family transcriptional regulator [Bosea lathyri]SEG76686.1 Helix-turn-helix domain-containing protein [Bosea lathyri]